MLKVGYSLAGASSFHRFMIADVSDKGMPAAFYMALSRNTLRSSITGDRSLAECLTRTNRLMSVDTANGMFVRLCYAQLDPATGELVYVNAGRNPPLWYRRPEDRLIEFVRTGPPLGAYVEWTFAQQTVHLDPGDFVLFDPDGVTDV